MTPWVWSRLKIIIIEIIIIIIEIIKPLHIFHPSNLTILIYLVIFSLNIFWTLYLFNIYTVSSNGYKSVPYITCQCQQIMADISSCQIWPRFIHSSSQSKVIFCNDLQRKKINASSHFNMTFEEFFFLVFFSFIFIKFAHSTIESFFHIKSSFSLDVPATKCTNEDDNDTTPTTTLLNNVLSIQSIQIPSTKQTYIRNNNGKKGQPGAKQRKQNI